MAKHVKCPVCGTTTGTLKRHLKDYHGYVYIEDSPDFPVAPNNNKPTARIRPSKGKGLWLIVDPPGASKVSAEDLDDLLEIGLHRDDLESSCGGVAYAIEENEVEAIRAACDEWLKNI